MHVSISIDVKYPNDEFEDQGRNENENVVEQFHQRPEEELESKSREQSRKSSSLEKIRESYVIKYRSSVVNGCRLV